MTTTVDERKMDCCAIDENTALLKIDDKNYVVDYSSLMDLIIRLTVVAAEIENQPQKIHSLH